MVQSPFPSLGDGSDALRWPRSLPPGPLAPRATAVSAVETTSGWDVQARLTDGERISGLRISDV